MEKIKIGILGYGNIARGVEQAIRQNEDLALAAVFTRRDPAHVAVQTPGVPVLHVDDAPAWRDRVDVMILCGGSATDLPAMGPQYAALFHTVDSFDTHARIPEYFENVDRAAKENGHLAAISIGWDPGLFSLNRLYGEAFLPQGAHYTFWGRGVSQGHSDALRRVPGVKDAVQYTVPVESAMEAARSGAQPQFTARQMHTRECFVVAEEGADRAEIERAICEMPNYFSDYDTTVHFISEEELQRDHKKMPHGGFVIRSGKTGENNREVMEFSLKLDSNPEFTASVLVCYARAVYRLAKQGQTGAVTAFDIAPALLSPKSPEELRATLL